MNVSSARGFETEAYKGLEKDHKANEGMESHYTAMDLKNLMRALLYIPL